MLWVRLAQGLACNYVFLKENNKYEVVADIFDDPLIGKLMCENDVKYSLMTMTAVDDVLVATFCIAAMDNTRKSQNLLYRKAN